MGELSETTMVKGVAECSACGGSGGVVELMTGWGSARPAWGWARQMGLLGAPVVSDELTGHLRIRVRGFSRGRDA